MCVLLHGGYKKKREIKILLPLTNPTVLIQNTVSHFLRRSFDTCEDLTRLDSVRVNHLRAPVLE